MKLQGGLGNQMFEYAFGRALQIKLGDELILDTSDFAYDELRNYSLGHFYLSNNMSIDSSGKYNMKYDQRCNKFLKLGVRFFPELQYSLLSRHGVYIWDYAKYKEVKLENCNEYYFHGYWQGYDYFSDSIDVIRDEFQVKDKIMSVNCELLKQIQETNSVCVHIRRGDFLSSSNKLYNCRNDYYIAGMQNIEKTNSELVYYIFSDDITEVKDKFSFGNRRVVYVEQRNPDYEELRLMYNCKHFIIANSTFSWWAAVLSKNPNKIVIAPKVWYTDHRDVSHLLLKKWNIVDNELDG